MPSYVVAQCAPWVLGVLVSYPVLEKHEKRRFLMSYLTIMTTCSRPFARARSPIFSQYLADSCSSPSIMVEPWEKKWTGAILPCLLFPTAILFCFASIGRQGDVKIPQEVNSCR